VSPDGDLNFIPFEALVDEHGHYLIERYAISYLTSGRDLLRMNHEPIKTGPPVVVANPLFGEPPRESGAPPPMYFAPLGGTAAEASAIATLFPSATLLTGRLATKDALQRLNAPRVLHIASHGFFLPDDSIGRQRGRGGRTAAARAAPVVAADVNPLLRSGLALAGANVPHGSSSDGILTALEASSLNLRGTKLVTLSACDTGIGEVKNGEGVYGLPRVRARGYGDAGDESLAGQRRRRARNDGDLLHGPARGPRTRRRTAPGEARHAAAEGPPPSVLLGQLHPVGRMGKPRRRAPFIRSHVGAASVRTACGIAAQLSLNDWSLFEMNGNSVCTGRVDV
jgi:hypothetical protein